MRRNVSFISTVELLERWQKDYLFLLSLIKKRELTWYNSEFIKYDSLEEEAAIEYEYFKYLTDDGQGVMTTRNVLQDRIGITENMDVNQLESGNYYFKMKEIEKYEEEHPEVKPQDAALSFSSNGEIPPYLDKKHPHYAAELAFAVKAWLAVFQGEQPPGRQTPKQRIQKYLTNNPESKDNKNLIERLTITCIPRKKIYSK
jgi:hypothetical protein